MDSKTIDFINYHAASYVNEFVSGDSTTRARMQEILTSFGKQLIDCLPREGKESQHESGNCIKPDVIKSVCDSCGCEHDLSVMKLCHICLNRYFEQTVL